MMQRKALVKKGAFFLETLLQEDEKKGSHGEKKKEIHLRRGGIPKVNSAFLWRTCDCGRTAL